MQRPYWTGAKPLGALTLGVYRHVGPVIDIALPPRFSAAAAEAGPQPRLTVLAGGRTD